LIDFAVSTANSPTRDRRQLFPSFLFSALRQLTALLLLDWDKLSVENRALVNLAAGIFSRNVHSCRLPF
jgi:hypothetical protein